MRIAVQTLVDNGNYGSELQAIAMNRLCGYFGHQTVFIVLKSPDRFERIIELLIDRLRNIINGVLDKEYRKNLDTLSKNRKSQKTISAELKNIVHVFVNQKIIIKRISRINFRNISFDYYICGSDQIWSPLALPIQSARFLPWVSSRRKMAYAPSLGINDVPEYYYKKVLKYLDRFEHLSFREESVARKIGERLNRKIPFVLDPTLLLGESEWCSMISGVNNPMKNRRYALCYFLGDVSEEAMKMIVSLSKEMEIVLLPYEHRLTSLECKTNYFPADPFEFLRLVQDAGIVLTDSFHGVCFSMLFRKPMRVYERNHCVGLKQTSRIHSLLKVLCLEENGETIFTEGAQEKLKQLQLESMRFFSSGIKGESFSE